MKYLSHVVWSEGMHLSPQHFETQSRYFEDLLWFLTGNLRSYPWGFLTLSLDTEAARNGLAVIRFASGIFPDGLPFEIPESDAPPAALRLRDLFGPLDSSVVLHLRVALRGDGILPAAANGNSSRYSGVERLVRDETVSDDEYPVTLGEKNLQLTGAAGSGRDLSLPVARVVRDGEGGFALDNAFLPPLLRLHASEDLVRRLGRLASALEDKIDTTRSGKRNGGRFEAGTSALDVASYWFLHTLCTTLPALRDHLRNRHVHPEDVYTTLAELAGALCTFAPDSDPAVLPPYNHLELHDAFHRLEDHIYRHLDYVVPSNTLTLTFAQTEQYVFVAPVTDERCLRRARWIFGIRSDVPETTLMRSVPTLAKICSGEGVVKLVQRALQGLALHHLPDPPSALAAQADMQYFTIDRAGPCWEHILATRQVGVYLPGELGHPVFEVTIIVENEP